MSILNFQMKNSDFFFLFLLEASIVASFCGLCLGVEIRKKEMPSVKPQFNYLTFGCEGIKSIQACCRDEDWQYYDHTMTSY